MNNVEFFVFFLLKIYICSQNMVALSAKILIKHQGANCLFEKIPEYSVYSA